MGGGELLFGDLGPFSLLLFLVVVAGQGCAAAKGRWTLGAFRDRKDYLFVCVCVFFSFSLF